MTGSNKPYEDKTCPVVDPDTGKAYTVSQQQMKDFAGIKSETNLTEKFQSFCGNVATDAQKAFTNFFQNPPVQKAEATPPAQAPSIAPPMS